MVFIPYRRGLKAEWLLLMMTLVVASLATIIFCNGEIEVEGTGNAVRKQLSSIVLCPVYAVGYQMDGMTGSEAEIILAIKRQEYFFLLYYGEYVAKALQ